MPGAAVVLLPPRRAAARKASNAGVEIDTGNAGTLDPEGDMSAAPFGATLAHARRMQSPPILKCAAVRESSCDDAELKMPLSIEPNVASTSATSAGVKYPASENCASICAACAHNSVACIEPRERAPGPHTWWHVCTMATLIASLREVCTVKSSPARRVCMVRKASAHSMTEAKPGSNNSQQRRSTTDASAFRTKGPLPILASMACAVRPTSGMLPHCLSAAMKVSASAPAISVSP
mmetsp:Transcript_115538/g.331630  ORF Transcript_115538/g.331630 Transcript_115538/m.331630 type:complete len:236 (+) Transcript_115538:499-1206(+)